MGSIDQNHYHSTAIVLGLRHHSVLAQTNPPINNWQHHPTTAHHVVRYNHHPRSPICKQQPLRRAAAAPQYQQMLPLVAPVLQKRCLPLSGWLLGSLLGCQMYSEFHVKVFSVEVSRHPRWSQVSASSLSYTPWIFAITSPL